MRNLLFFLFAFVLLCSHAQNPDLKISEEDYGDKSNSVLGEYGNSLWSLSVNKADGDYKWFLVKTDKSTLKKTSEIQLPISRTSLWKGNLAQYASVGDNIVRSFLMKDKIVIRYDSADEKKGLTYANILVYDLAAGRVARNFNFLSAEYESTNGWKSRKHLTGFSFSPDSSRILAWGVIYGKSDATIKTTVFKPDFDVVHEKSETFNVAEKMAFSFEDAYILNNGDYGIFYAQKIKLMPFKDKNPCTYFLSTFSPGSNKTRTAKFSDENRFISDGQFVNVAGNAVFAGCYSIEQHKDVKGIISFSAEELLKDASAVKYLQFQNPILHPFISVFHKGITKGSRPTRGTYGLSFRHAFEADNSTVTLIIEDIDYKSIDVTNEIVLRANILLFNYNFQKNEITAKAKIMRCNYEIGDVEDIAVGKVNEKICILYKNHIDNENKTLTDEDDLKILKKYKNSVLMSATFDRDLNMTKKQLASAENVEINMMLRDACLYNTSLAGPGLDGKKLKIIHISNAVNK